MCVYVCVCIYINMYECVVDTYDIYISVLQQSLVLQQCVAARVAGTCALVCPRHCVAAKHVAAQYIAAQHVAAMCCSAIRVAQAC